ncbi:MAG TPA: glycosyltransferase family 9 protein [Candidatus Caenarcaniphilales bacterium]
MTRMLALVPGGIDHQILCFPTLDDLQQHYPQAQVDVVVEPCAKSAYRLCQAVNEVITFDFKNRNSLADWGNLLGNLRDREYDVALSVGQGWAINFLLWLAGIPTRIGYANGRNNLFLTHVVPMKSEQYAAEMYHDLLQGLGITTPSPQLAIQVPKKDIDWAEAEQNRLGLLGPNGGQYVLMHSGSNGPLAASKGIDQTYPVQNWQKIIQDFQQRQPDLPIVVVQGPETQLSVAALLQACPDLKVTAPGDMGKLASMIAGASLMVCTESAPMQLAVAVQTYTIALFGPTEPAKLLPISDRFIGIKSQTGRIGDISPAEVLERIWSA